MRPRVITYNAVSVDGRITGFMPDLGVFYGLAQHWNEDATLVGSATILAAPEGLEETVPDAGTAAEPDEHVEPIDMGRTPGARSRPYLVVVDSRGAVTKWPFLRRQPFWDGLIALCSDTTPAEHLERLNGWGVTALRCGEDRVDLGRALERLYERFGIRTVRVDSGGRLIGQLLSQGLVDEVSILIEPVLVGGTGLSSIFHAPEPVIAAQPITVRLSAAERLPSGHMWLRYEVAQ